ncbi:MAG: hypothetical protein BSOLF_0484 [Candidatus Carbobacillus altaicus]|uniref:Uncharacterized protein n=1 Tax=Candidatus Carbonibacillus altaicus TaxID=2163959 RepID=A0A2R6Y0U6_9BACL|nr:MAG: hypothetical protein BSOLF_0484 [Candidatus Carbobacillus altaicus]
MQIEAILQEHPESGDRRLEAELRQRGKERANLVAGFLSDTGTGRL